MGIPKFFYYIYKNIPFSLYHVTNKINNAVDVYCIDLNALIHPVCQSIYGYNGNKSLLHPIPNKIIDEKTVYKEICKSLLDLIKLVKPRKTIFIAIDGVAGMSKITQQRQRRFLSVKSKSKEEFERFDSNSITVGTEFMYNFSKYLHSFIKSLKTKLPYLTIIISDEKVPGEGEHKLLRYIETQSKELIYCIDSPDADLIMLLLGIHYPNLYILRKNIYKDVDCKYFFVSLDKIKEYILRKINTDNEKCIDDFIFLSFLFGNDFLPCIPGLEIQTSGRINTIDLMLDIYSIIYKENKSNIINKVDNSININIDIWKSILKELVKFEYDLISMKLKAKFPDNLLQESTINGYIDLDLYKKKRYNIKLDNIDRKILAKEYFRGMYFNILYYLVKIPSWKWFYPFHYAPFISDLYNLDFEDEKISFDIDDPLTPFEQLLSVLPSQSYKLLPLEYKDIFIEEKYYPLDFKEDIEGKYNDYEAIALLPFINIDYIQEQYKKRNVKEYKRNIKGDNIMY